MCCHDRLCTSSVVTITGNYITVYVTFILMYLYGILSGTKTNGEAFIIAPLGVLKLFGNASQGIQLAYIFVQITMVLLIKNFVY